MPERQSMLVFCFFLLLFSFETGTKAEEPKKERNDLTAMVIRGFESGKLAVIGPSSDMEVGTLGRLVPAFAYRVVQVIDENNMLVQVKGNTRPAFWMRGISTNGIIDDGFLPDTAQEQLIILSGTKRYNTAAGGTNTVLVFDAVDGDLRREAMKRLDEKEKKLRTRDWVDSSGKYEINAEFLEYENGNVKLRRKDDGTEIDVPMLKLSKESQKWVRDWLRGTTEREAIRKRLEPAKSKD